VESLGGEVDHELWQSRLSRFGRVLAIVSLGFPLLNTIFSVWLHRPVFNRVVVPPTVAAVVFGALWLLLRGPPRPRTFIRVVEVATLFAGTTAFATLVLVMPLVAQPEPVMRGALTFLLLAYAVYVPNTPRRTLVIGSLMAVPLLCCVYVAYSAWDPAVHDAPGALWPKGMAVAHATTIYSAVWWTMAVAMAVGFSRVLYGLRKEVRDIRRLGQYALEEKLGEGGMGVVYRGSHAMLRRPTAIKLLLPDRAGKDALARFEREVQRTAMLRHPNTVTVFDYGRTSDGIFYYAMELLEGASLDELVEIDGAQPEERVIHLLEQAAGSLAEAHDAGLIHRDIKPGNILIVDHAGLPDMVKVVDFGLVKDVGYRTSDGRTPEPALTEANTITGTPLYIAPEGLVAPENIDARADLYALGAVGYWLLTGTHVFDGRSVVEVFAHHLHTAPEPPSTRLGAPIASDLEAVLLECLAKRPEDRPASAHVLRERLLACAAAGRWTHARAAQWWKVHGDELRSNRARARAASRGEPHAATVTVGRVAG
jgi:serine/threonine-protein kinase